MSLRERLADLCHKQWSGWMEYLFSKCDYYEIDDGRLTGDLVIPESLVKRWKRQMNTLYEDLSGEEKQSERREADRFIGLLINLLLEEAGDNENL